MALQHVADEAANAAIADDDGAAGMIVGRQDRRLRLDRRRRLGPPAGEVGREQQLLALRVLDRRRAPTE